MGRLKAPPKRLAVAPRVVGYADRQAAERGRDHLRRQNAGKSLRKLYNTKRWRDPVTGLRVKVLTRDNWKCKQTGVDLVGGVNAPDSPIVDHIEPHRGNLALFWDEANLQAVSKAWHDSEKQRQERGGAKGGGGSKV